MLNQPFTGISGGARCAAGLVLLAVAVTIAWPPPAIADPKPSRLERQIEVMAGLMDRMLVDSPNFLVSGKQTTNGIEAEDYGAIFAFEASLTGPLWEEGSWGRTSSWWPAGKKQKVVVIKGDGDKEKQILLDGGKIIIDDGTVYIDEGGKRRKLTEKDDLEFLDEKTYRDKQLEKYAAAKAELVQFLLDYGETLKALPAGQTVRIIVRWNDLDLPEGKEVRRLSLRVAADDLRAGAEGRLTEEALRSRIQIKES